MTWRNSYVWISSLPIVFDFDTTGLWSGLKELGNSQKIKILNDMTTISKNPKDYHVFVLLGMAQLDGVVEREPSLETESIVS